MATETGMMDRRDFVKAAGAAFVTGLTPERVLALTAADAVYAAAYGTDDGRFGLALLDEKGTILHRRPLDARGHGIAAHRETGRLVAFARRPGLFAVAIDITSRRSPVSFHAPASRHFYGHGAFSADGRLLYATENVFDAARGAVGIYDATDGFRRIGEFDTGGTGPHELLLMPDGQHLVVANGGIETHPDYGRAKLNLSSMEASMALIDIANGDLLERHTLPPEHHQLSIRHIAADPSGRVWYGAQNQAAHSSTDTTSAGPLVGSFRPGEELKGLANAGPALAALNGYVGSVAVSHDGETAAATSPQGNVVIFWNTETGGIVGSRSEADVCGAAASGGADFAWTTGTGRLRIQDGKANRSAGLHWDNHLVRL